MTTRFLFTSESVTAGHPDKLCDRISDAIVGRMLKQDAASSVSAECAISKGIVFIALRRSSEASIDLAATARDVIRRAGYDKGDFDVDDCTVLLSITEGTPPDPRLKDLDTLDPEAFDRLEVRDQATVFGYASAGTPQMMPMPIWLAHRLARQLAEVHRRGELPWLTSDARTQVGIEYENRRPLCIHSLAVEASHHFGASPALDELREAIRELVIRPALDGVPIPSDQETRYFINPAGLAAGGPNRHAGMTGRKTAGDTYGEFARCSASALSGKDPTRIDRIGNYIARYAAKNVVAAGLARECEVQLTYTIGLPGPASIQIETFDTESIPESDIVARLTRHIDFRLAAILRKFELQKLPARDPHGFFEHLAAYGQVGRDDLHLPWEQTDKKEELKLG